MPGCDAPTSKHQYWATGHISAILAHSTKVYGTDGTETGIKDILKAKTFQERGGKTVKKLICGTDKL